MRTAILPFVFIFNPEMLLIGVESWAHTAVVIAASIVAILLFAAASMNWFVTRAAGGKACSCCCCFALFRPDFFINRFYPATIERAGVRQLMSEVQQAPDDTAASMVADGTNLEGEDVRKTVSLPLGTAGEAARAAARGRASVTRRRRQGHDQPCRVRIGRQADRAAKPATRSLPCSNAGAGTSPRDPGSVIALLRGGHCWLQYSRSAGRSLPSA